MENEEYIDVFNDQDMMYQDAQFIADLCGSDYASDKQLAELSEKFTAKYGCHWSEILN